MIDANYTWSADEPISEWNLVHLSPPRKKKKERKKRKKEGNYESRQITTYEMLFYQFSIVRWHWKI